VAFGATLRAWRNDADLSLRELAQKVGIDFTQLSKIETGALGPPSDDQIRTLVRALGRPSAHADELIRLARDTNIPPSAIRSVLIKNPDLGALLRRIQQRPQQRLSEEEAASLRRIAEQRPGRKDDLDDPAAS
jgi:transcriptional regulator with XRE-family HTH domain